MDFCSNIENYTDDPIYSEVEKEVLKIIVKPGSKSKTRSQQTQSSSNKTKYFRLRLH